MSLNPINEKLCTLRNIQIVKGKFTNTSLGSIYAPTEEYKDRFYENLEEVTTLLFKVDSGRRQC